jgi:hypothetical protein
MRRDTLLVGLAAMGLVAVPSLQAVAQSAPDKTRVVVLVLDGLNIEEVPLMPFVSSLAAEGTYYTESRSVMIAETTPNHAAMVTGVYPDRSGIVANNFPDPQTGEVVDNGDTGLLEADSLFSLVARQCPQLTTAAVTSKDYLFNLMEHDRTGDGMRDADSNFANLDDPTFIPGVGITPDERTMTEAIRVSRELDPDFQFVNLGSIDRTGHVDPVGGATTPTGSRPAVRDVQRTLTDTYVRAFVEQLKADGKWDSTALLITADHSMDWSLPTSTVSLFPRFQADPLLMGEIAVAQNGGAALYSLRDRTSPQAPERLKRMREIAVATDGVDEALYRVPNPLDGGEEHWVGRVHPDWHQTHPRSGDLLVTVEDGRRASEPGPVSNPIPGNHGMSSTVRIPTIVTGGIETVRRTVPGEPDPFVRADDQAENVDMAPTAAWLLGVQPPDGGFDGRVLSEAFVTQPAPVCVQAAGQPGAGPGQPGAGPGPGSGDGGTAGTDGTGGTASGRSGGSLAATGVTWGLPAAGLALLGAAVVLRRRTRA